MRQTPQARDLEQQLAGARLGLGDARRRAAARPGASSSAARTGSSSTLGAMPARTERFDLGAADAAARRGAPPRPRRRRSAGFEFGGDSYVPEPAEVPVVLDIARMASGWSLRLRFTAGLAGPCMRCLEPALVRRRGRRARDRPARRRRGADEPLRQRRGARPRGLGARRLRAGAAARRSRCRAGLRRAVPASAARTSTRIRATPTSRRSTRAGRSSRAEARHRATESGPQRNAPLGTYGASGPRRPRVITGLSTLSGRRASRHGADRPLLRGGQEAGDRRRAARRVEQRPPQRGARRLLVARGEQRDVGLAHQRERTVLVVSSRAPKRSAAAMSSPWPAPRTSRPIASASRPGLARVLDARGLRAVPRRGRVCRPRRRREHVEAAR